MIAAVLLSPPVAGGALAGHDALVPIDTPIKRFPGMVASLASAPDDSQHLYSFTTTNTDFRPGELRSWRLTFISGELFGKQYQVQDNTPSAITVTDANGPLDGLAEGDAFLVEQVLVRSVPSRR